MSGSCGPRAGEIGGGSSGSPRCLRIWFHAGEAEAEDAASEIAVEFVLDVSRYGPLSGFPPGEPALDVPTSPAQ
jgi:hypothetical protein